MFGKVIETFGTEDCTYVCECPICKTNYVIKPGAKDETGVLITTRNVNRRADHNEKCGYRLSYS